jgi:hypothetical protein
MTIEGDETLLGNPNLSVPAMVDIGIMAMAKF